jgi:DNA mismatch repair ATPase MutS
MLIAELDDAYLAEVDQHLKNLDLRKAVHMSAGLGDGLANIDFVLHPPSVRKSRWFEWFEGLDGVRVKGDRSYVYSSRSHNDRGLRDLADLREEGIALVSDAVDQASEHLLGFLQILRAELGFYVGCVALHDALVSTGNPTCFPVPAVGDATLACRGLYEPCLALTTGGPVVGNDVDALDAQLIVVTGANQGGKSTFLRSVGLAQLMAQAGMFAPATALEISPCAGLFTHFRREEDATMTSGKLDEEFTRMSTIVDHLTPGALILLNESFAATNEREGSHVSREIILALMESGVRAVFVTHLYGLAHGLYADRMPGTVFLRAPRADDGTRSFRLVEGEPLPTSFGRDVFVRVFGGAGTNG